MPFRYDIGISSGKRIQGEGIEIGNGASGYPYLINARSLMFHTLITGRTGTGKSNLLLNLCKNILKVESSNMIVIDFHGSLSDHIITMIDNKKLIYLGSSPDGKSVVKMNILKGASQSSVSFYLIQEIFSRESSLSGGTWGPRLQTIFTSVLREILLREPEATLSDFMDTLLSKEMMKSLSASCTKESRKVIENLISKWQSWIEYSSSSINKLYPILSDPKIKSLVSSRNESVDIIKELTEGDKVVVIDVSKTRFSTTQGKIISSLILNRIWTEILKEGITPQTMIVADEAQNLNSSVLSEILSEGRKFKTYLTVASQYLDQYDRYTKGSLLSNCGSIYSFNVSERDAMEITNVITNRKKKTEALKSILLGTPHNVTHFNFLSKSGIEVDSFIPYLIDTKVNKIEVESRVGESLDLYGNDTDEEPMSEILTLPDHTYLSTFMLRFLESRDIFPERERKLNSLRPDILFYYNNRPVVVEIEVSDVGKFSRVVEKAVNYSSLKLIFLCGRNMGRILYEKFCNRDSMRNSLENLKMKGSGSYYDYRNILICEERNGILYLVVGGKLVRFSIDKLENYRTFVEQSVMGSSFIEICMNEMRRKSDYFLSIEEINKLWDKAHYAESFKFRNESITIFDLYE